MGYKQKYFCRHLDNCELIWNICCYKVLCPQVYRGTLPNGQLVAIKRSQRESKQGENEFKAEIELLSRVHHKNLVRLVGFCFDRREQMLVYEYVPNGTLRDTISGIYVHALLPI